MSAIAARLSSGLKSIGGDLLAFLPTTTERSGLRLVSDFVFTAFLLGSQATLAIVHDKNPNRSTFHAGALTHPSVMGGVSVQDSEPLF
jgi:hypothetical protein